MGILDESVDMLRIYRYKVNNVYIIFPKDSHYDDYIVTLPSHRVSSLVVLDNYIENVYPIICIRISIEDSLYERIIEFKDSVKFQIDIRKYYTEQDTGEDSLCSAHMNVTYQLILDDAENTVNKTLRNSEFPEGDTDELMGIKRSEEFYLFNEEMIRSNTSLINGVLKNATVSDAIAAILRAANIKRNLIMPAVSNTQIYPYLVIPPLRITKALQFIESYYGMYRTGSIIYFGMDRNYIIPYCIRSRARAYNEPEMVNIIVPQTGSSITDILCSVVKKGEPNTPYVIADNTSFEPINEDVSNQILCPNDIDVIDNTYGTLTTETASKAKNKKVILQPGENIYYQEAFRLRKEALSMTIRISVKNCDLSIFTPNKVYQFLFEDTSLMRLYRGKYHLVNKETAYVKESDVFVGGASLTFHKNVG